MLPKEHLEKLRFLSRKGYLPSSHQPQKVASRGGGGSFTLRRLFIEGSSLIAPSPPEAIIGYEGKERKRELSVSEEKDLGFWPKAIINERHRGVGLIFLPDKLMFALNGSNIESSQDSDFRLEFFPTLMYLGLAGRHCSARYHFGSEESEENRRWSLLIHLAFLISSQTKTLRTSRLTHPHRILESNLTPRLILPVPARGRITLTDPWLALIYHHRRNDLPGPNKKLARPGRTRTEGEEEEGGNGKAHSIFPPSFRGENER